MTLRALVPAATVALAIYAGAAATDSGATTAACNARPVVEEFFTALNAGDVARLDQLFAAAGEGWNWYSVGDLAGQRLRADSKERSTLAAYFASRVRQSEELRLLRIDENGNGNFGIVLLRRADDLRDGEPVQRHGKGWVSCATGKIGVWSLGGAPPPKSFGPCPQGALPLRPADLGGASAAALEFVHDTFSEMWPVLDVAGARARRAAPAPVSVKGATARTQCGRAVQRRTAVIEVRFPRVYSSEPMASVAFYASRTRAGWLVWRFVD